MDSLFEFTQVSPPESRFICETICRDLSHKALQSWGDHNVAEVSSRLLVFSLFTVFCSLEREQNHGRVPLEFRYWRGRTTTLPVIPDNHISATSLSLLLSRWNPISQCGLRTDGQHSSVPKRCLRGVSSIMSMGHVRQVGNHCICLRRLSKTPFFVYEKGRSIQVGNHS